MCPRPGECLPWLPLLILGTVMPKVASADDLPYGGNSEAPTALGFDEAVERALSNNPTVAASQQEVARSEAVLTSVRAAWLPSLYANGVYTRLDADRKLDTRVTSPADQLSANLLLTVPLLTPQRWVQSAHAGNDVDSAKLALGDVRRTLAVSVARTYLAIITQHRVVDINTQALQTAKAHQEFALRRWQEHYGSRLDEVRARQESATAAAQLETARAQLATLQESLGGLLGNEQAVDAGDEPKLELSQDDLAESQQAPSEQMLSNRSDLRLAAQLVQSSQHIVDDDWTLHAPTLAGTFSPFYQDPPTLVLPRTGWQAQLVLQVPLFEGNLRIGQAKEHRQVVARQQLELDARLITARAEVRGARKEVTRLQAALTQARAAAELAAEAFSLADLAYKGGATTNLEVVDAERRSRDAATAAAVAADAHRRAQLGLAVALGRFPPR